VVKVASNKLDIAVFDIVFFEVDESFVGRHFVYVCAIEEGEEVVGGVRFIALCLMYVCGMQR
jgi:hypothetical protein